MNAATIIETTTQNQRRAADPAMSTFVSANAGAGKTRVLTNRVARLLLERVSPSTILCITFTKAAAAEMAERLFKLLGSWALADDETLRAALAELDGAGRPRDGEELARARRLFARALETPGGLKIQTIHSFCESVLKRFPLEAGVPPGFNVIEDLESASLKHAAVDLAAAAAHGDAAAAFRHLLSRMNGGTLRDLLINSLGDRGAFACAEALGWEGVKSQIAQTLDVDETTSADKLTDEMFALLDRTRLADAWAAFEASGGNPKKYCAPPLQVFLESDIRSERLAALIRLFLDTNSNPRAKFGTKATEKIDPTIEDYMCGERDKFVAALDRIRAAKAFADTSAYLTLAETAFGAYDDMKSKRACLDFHDLISKTSALLRSPGGAQWVLYKLDMGLEHILLDEAQDTGPDAWNVIEAPLQEFFAGVGAHDRKRTFFAVGDQKQSIYSFQGADAALFAEKERDLGEKIAAASEFECVPLNASFRTTAPVLEFVDALFADDAVIDNVSDIKPLIHHCTRTGRAGLVELWPRVPKPERAAPNPWDAPIDAPSAQNPARTLADAVAAMVAGWLRDGEILESQGRPIEPGDIMILVQNRGGQSKSALFSEVIRALGAAKAPVAGADKFRLTDDQAALDLLSYARAVLFKGDDLSLAETLKSPFFNIGEDSLYDLAANRGRRRLWNELRARAGERAEWACACEEIRAARTIALRDGAAAFFTHILETGAPSGWRRLADRLGEPMREAVEELLRLAHDFELRNPRSLRLFLGAIIGSNAEVSRDASEHGSFIRVMTVHKSKGLEANIVILIDAHLPAQTNKAGAILRIAGPNGDMLPALALDDARDMRLLSEARERRKSLIRDEYRRLLYVAATRARDRLYICGLQSGNVKNPRAKAPAERDWHSLACDAFERLGAGAQFAGERFGAEVLRLSSSQTAAPDCEKRDTEPTLDSPVPDYLMRSATAEAAAKRLSPSDLAHGEDGPAYSPARAKNRFLRGRLLHRLLELLPEVPPESRRRAADRILSPYAGEFGRNELDAMREEAMRVLEDPSFAPVFARGGIAEAAIGGRAKGARAGVILSGQIDRLAFDGDRILIVDYKSNRPPPTRVSEVAPAYVAQLAAYRGLLQEIYPDRKIEAALVWTYDARLMPIPDEMLDAAFKMTLA
ncbi:MAG: double-strand break repair helicase AddA [Parvularculaceae bacterium]|nr:double-strand break repair helicase AddA [Parvularculaceae bacterium]